MRDLSKLRHQCHVLIAKKGFAKKGSQAVLARHIQVNKNSLSMALSGFRETSGSEQILKALKRFLNTNEQSEKTAANS